MLFNNEAPTASTWQDVTITEPKEAVPNLNTNLCNQTLIIFG